MDKLFQIVAIIILVAFYSIYIGKMIVQKRKGIQTNQIARGKKSEKLFKTEIFLKIATYSVVFVGIISIFLNTTLMNIYARIIGVILGILGVMLFAVAVYTMKESWRAGIPEKGKTELITAGIFKLSRNPAFLAFDLIYIGILLMFFNWILFVFTIFAIVMLHLQILQEEEFLQKTFGEKYLNYKRKTKRYVG